MKQLAWAFYEWMGSLSIDEIISNKELIEKLENFQKKFILGGK